MNKYIRMKVPEETEPTINPGCPYCKVMMELYAGMNPKPVEAECRVGHRVDLSVVED